MMANRETRYYVPQAGNIQYLHPSGPSGYKNRHGSAWQTMDQIKRDYYFGPDSRYPTPESFQEWYNSGGRGLQPHLPTSGMDMIEGPSEENVPMSSNDSTDVLRGGSGSDRITDRDQAKIMIYARTPYNQWDSLRPVLERMDDDTLSSIANAAKRAPQVQFLASPDFVGGIGVKGVSPIEWNNLLQNKPAAEAARTPPFQGAQAEAQVLPGVASQPATRAIGRLVPTQAVTDVPFTPDQLMLHDDTHAPMRVTGQGAIDLRPSAAAARAASDVPLPPERPDTRHPTYPAGYKDPNYVVPTRQRDLNFNRHPVGKDVADIQRQLASAVRKDPLTGEMVPYYTGKIDGVGGPVTKAALAQYQRDNPWTGTSVANIYRSKPNGFPDAIAGARTRRSLEVVQGPDLPVVGNASRWTGEAFPEPSAIPGEPSRDPNRFGPGISFPSGPGVSRAPASDYPPQNWSSVQQPYEDPTLYPPDTIGSAIQNWGGHKWFDRQTADHLLGFSPYETPVYNAARSSDGSSRGDRGRTPADAAMQAVAASMDIVGDTIHHFTDSSTGNFLTNAGRSDSGASPVRSASGPGIGPSIATYSSGPGGGTESGGAGIPWSTRSPSGADYSNPNAGFGGYGNYPSDYSNY